MGSLKHDLRYAMRSMRRNPGVSAIAVATVALGIGLTTAIFSAVNGILLKPLPFPDPHRLVLVEEYNLATGGEPQDVSYRNFVDLRAAARSFDDLAAISAGLVTLAGGEEPERILSATVSPALFAILGARPALGRLLGADDETEGVGERVVLLSHRLWRRALGADPAAVGRSVTLDGEPFTIVGVMPPGFSFPSEEVELWTPLDLSERWRETRAVHVLTVLGRLHRGVELEGANAELEAIAARIQREHGAEDPEHSAAARPLHQVVVGDTRPALLLLLGSVVLVLLIACANVANLLLARANARRREIAVRGALGASRRRLVRQLLTESMVIALGAGALGVLLGYWGVRGFAAALPPDVPRASEVGLDPVVLVFALLVTVATGLLFGILPAVRGSRVDPSGWLAETEVVGGLLRSRARSALAGGQIALSLILLIGAGLLLKSLWRVTNVDPGFEPQGLLTLTVSLIGTTYDEAPEVIDFYRRLPARLEAVPGVESVSGVNWLPVSGGDSEGQLTIESRPFAPGQAPSASFRRILPGYFATLTVPLLQGRDFDQREADGEAWSVIINETMARRYWPDGDALGKRIKVGPAEAEPWLTVVGVVGDVRNVGLDTEPRLATYEPHAQRPWSTMKLVVRTVGEPLSVLSSVTTEIRASGGPLPIYEVSTMQGRIRASMAPRRWLAGLLGAFAAVAALLAALGLYGVIAYSVGLRTREIGLRIALGAAAADALALVLREGLRITALGMLVGLVGALALTRLLADLLHEVSAFDAWTFVSVSILIVVVAVGASWLPARRAACLDPMTALRHE